jgi:hypothetical protein
MSKMTNWFPTHIKPVRVGVYITQFWNGVFWEYGFSYWNGKKWANSNGTPEIALLNKKWISGAVQDRKWLGFTEKQQ